MDVRQACPEDRAAAVASVVGAFARDPAWSFILSSDYDRLGPHFAGTLFDLRVGTADVWVAGDADAVAMWEPPQRTGLPPADVERAWSAYRALAGEQAWQRLVAYERAVDAARPDSPHWYLGVLATRPDRQRQGLATAVIAPILDTADDGALDCCLETSTVANKSFYERRGFTEVTPVHIESGPPTWWLRRAPRRRS